MITVDSWCLINPHHVTHIQFDITKDTWFFYLVGGKYISINEYSKGKIIVDKILKTVQ
ncbi:hypothetical protein F989_02431 [Acinetobacter parvus NIPH 1103]|mgnify:FL=1|uniref:Uncharacterized protein n=1 Tax=Acinetobacter parvus NIPH 1103 TaxID=1217671 RepID=N8Q113_9GAMM|nr:hypothetical protein F989_02431 [Acinetobacter parvus NIPH 1103]